MQVWTASTVTRGRRRRAWTWARAHRGGHHAVGGGRRRRRRSVPRSGCPLDPMGRVRVEPDLALPGHPEVFVVGDQAHVEDEDGRTLPGLAPVAMQQGRFVARRASAPTSRARQRGPLPLPGPGPAGHHRPRSRAICAFGPPALRRLLRLALLAVRPHLLPGGLQEPAPRGAPVGVVLPVLRPWGPADREPGLALGRRRRRGLSPWGENHLLRGLPFLASPPCDSTSSRSRARRRSSEAQSQAAARGHSEIQPAHLLSALLGQPEGSTVPVLQKLGVSLDALQGELEQILEGIPKVSGRRPAPALAHATARVLEAAFQEAEQLKDEYVSTEHLLLAIAAEKQRPGRPRAARRRRRPRRHPEGARRRCAAAPASPIRIPSRKYQALEKFGRDLTDVARKGKLDPVVGRDEEIRRVDAGALAPHQEQPGADRRARRRQDRHRRGARPAHRRRRRARVA